ncbi:hypothetical protein F4693_001549 [Sphingomonas endophytica]|uniref:Uncharacterized protein n=1 Tax=Sphingomonas endophytica TaxID=869719 RepID=A0A7X0JBJ3_9SPHN|nr:hypothetical protein [Sphingomonas endophytica]
MRIAAVTIAGLRAAVDDHHLQAMLRRGIRFDAGGGGSNPRRAFSRIPGSALRVNGAGAAHRRNELLLDISPWHRATMSQRSSNDEAAVRWPTRAPRFDNLFRQPKR